MRLIDGDALKAVFDGLFFPQSTQEICDVIDAQPTIDVQPVRHSKWVKSGEHSYCTECGAMMSFPWYWFCGKCGARMY